MQKDIPIGIFCKRHFLHNIYKLRLRLEFHVGKHWIQIQDYLKTLFSPADHSRPVALPMYDFHDSNDIFVNPSI